MRLETLAIGVLCLALGAGAALCDETKYVLGAQSEGFDREMLPETQDLPLVLTVPDPTVAVVDKPVKVKKMKYTQEATPPPPLPNQAKSKKDLAIKSMKFKYNLPTGFTATCEMNHTWPRVVKWAPWHLIGVRLSGPFIVPPGQTTATISGIFAPGTERIVTRFSAGPKWYETGVVLEPVKKK